MKQLTFTNSYRPTPVLDLYRVIALTSIRNSVQSFYTEGVGTVDSWEVCRWSIFKQAYCFTSRGTNSWARFAFRRFAFVSRSLLGTSALRGRGFRATHPTPALTFRTIFGFSRQLFRFSATHAQVRGLGKRYRYGLVRQDATYTRLRRWRIRRFKQLRTRNLMARNRRATTAYSYLKRNVILGKRYRSSFWWSRSFNLRKPVALRLSKLSQIFFRRNSQFAIVGNSHFDLGASRYQTGMLDPRALLRSIGRRFTRRLWVSRRFQRFVGQKRGVGLVFCEGFPKERRRRYPQYWKKTKRGVKLKSQKTSWILRETGYNAGPSRRVRTFLTAKTFDGSMAYATGLSVGDSSAFPFHVRRELGYRLDLRPQVGRLRKFIAFVYKKLGVISRKYSAAKGKKSVGRLVWLPRFQDKPRLRFGVADRDRRAMLRFIGGVMRIAAPRRSYKKSAALQHHRSRLCLQMGARLRRGWLQRVRLRWSALFGLRSSSSALRADTKIADIIYDKLFVTNNNPSMVTLGAYLMKHRARSVVAKRNGRRGMFVSSMAEGLAGFTKRSVLSGLYRRHSRSFMEALVAGGFAYDNLLASPLVSFSVGARRRISNAQALRHAAFVMHQSGVTGCASFNQLRRSQNTPYMVPNHTFLTKNRSQLFSRRVGFIDKFFAYALVRGGAQRFDLDADTAITSLVKPSVFGQKIPYSIVSTYASTTPTNSNPSFLRAGSLLFRVANSKLVNPAWLAFRMQGVSAHQQSLFQYANGFYPNYAYGQRLAFRRQSGSAASIRILYDNFPRIFPMQLAPTAYLENLDLRLRRGFGVATSGYMQLLCASVRSDTYVSSFGYYRTPWGPAYGIKKSRYDYTIRGVRKFYIRPVYSRSGYMPVGFNHRPRFVGGVLSDFRPTPLLVLTVLRSFGRKYLRGLGIVDHDSSLLGTGYSRIARASVLITNQRRLQSAFVAHVVAWYQLGGLNLIASRRSADVARLLRSHDLLLKKYLSVEAEISRFRFFDHLSVYQRERTARSLFNRARLLSRRIPNMSAVTPRVDVLEKNIRFVLSLKPKKPNNTKNVFKRLRKLQRSSVKFCSLRALLGFSQKPRNEQTAFCHRFTFGARVFKKRTGCSVEKVTRPRLFKRGKRRDILATAKKAGFQKPKVNNYAPKRKLTPAQLRWESVRQNRNRRGDRENHRRVGALQNRLAPEVSSGRIGAVARNASIINWKHRAFFRARLNKQLASKLFGSLSPKKSKPKPTAPSTRAVTVSRKRFRLAVKKARMKPIGLRFRVSRFEKRTYLLRLHAASRARSLRIGLLPSRMVYKPSGLIYNKTKTTVSVVKKCRLRGVRRTRLALEPYAMRYQVKYRGHSSSIFLGYRPRFAPLHSGAPLKKRFKPRKGRGRSRRLSAKAAYLELQGLLTKPAPTAPRKAKPRRNPERSF